MEGTRRLTGRSKMALAALAAALVLCTAALVLAPEKAYAYGFKQTAATKDSATITWEDPNAGSSFYTTTGYTVQWGEEYGKVTKSATLPGDAEKLHVHGTQAGYKVLRQGHVRLYNSLRVL
ncbi:hypothetical protein [Adlercreutzia caecimuris]|uniref:hypothetical protein n=1 Tax=Adlercreutzia caecimuris TaxID=671266 RepID=UPI00272D7D69|nr:hypothetical protein [Adlercreutzia caecimuris]